MLIDSYGYALKTRARGTGRSQIGEVRTVDNGRLTDSG